MNVDLKRVRESGLEDGPSPAKRRATVIPEPDDDKLEDWMKVVETKRKEAIYRQMLEYRRAFEQEQRRASEMEAQRKVLEASVFAVEVCWTQLVTAVMNLAPVESAQSTEEEALQPLLDPQLPRPELEAAVQSRLPATTQLVKRIADLAEKNAPLPASTEALQKRFSRLQAESSSHRSHAQALYAEVTSMTGSRDSLQKELQQTRKSLDRQRMEHDRVEQEWRAGKERERDSGTPGLGKLPNGSGHATPNGKTDEDVKPFAGAVSTSISLLPDTSELELLTETRLKQLEVIRREHTTLQQEHDRLKVLANTPTEAAIRESPFFQVYLNQLAVQNSRVAALQQRLDANENLLDQLRIGNQTFKDSITNEARQEAESLRLQLQRKDQDLARVRGLRDEQTDENLERKAKETEWMRHGEEMENLVKSRGDRIGYLVAEVRRLKGCLGASDGSRGYLAFLNGEGGVDGDYVKDLERRLEEAKTKGGQSGASASAEGSISQNGRDHSEKTVGGSSALAAVIKQKDILELKVSESDVATNALYTEVEGLSKLYETLDKTVQKKVFDLRDMEIRIARSLHEKAKADNKYFQAMRAKDTIDVECKTAQKSVERQMKLLERAHEVERSLTAQIVAHESGLAALKNSALDLQSQLAVVTSEKVQIELRLQQNQTSLADAQQIMKQRVAEAAADKASREKFQEDADKAEKKYKKLLEKHDAMVASTASGENASAGEWKMQAERDKLWKLLRCSCCEQNFKQQVIIRCMHTFCKDCLDSRVASRQRKCPACGVAFAKEDVQTLYWQ